MSNAPAGVGVMAYAAAMGAGADNGLADILNSANPTDFSDVGLLQDRKLGATLELATSGGLSLVNLGLAGV